MSRVVALVGRPNVGKSTLFNRLSTSKKSIVHDMPGVTRDRIFSPARLGTLEFTVVDTPGLEDAQKATLEHEMLGQAFAAVASADLVCLIVDAKSGITPMDQFFANMLRKKTKHKILLVANKSEGVTNIDNSFYKLGFGEPIFVSAEHKVGFADLCEKFLEFLPKESDLPDDPFKSDSIQITICGKPNSGKSTFINAILGDNRLLTGEKAGITRDAIEVEWEYKNTKLKLIDTAGVRRKTHITDSLEKMSVSSTLHSIRFSNTVILMIDANEGISTQDLNLANLIINEGRSLIIAINKWDLIENKKIYKSEFENLISKNLSQVQNLPVVYISAKNSENILSVIDECLNIYKIWNKKISTGILNKWLSKIIEDHPLPLKSNGSRVKIKYCAQINIRPPLFKFFTNHPDEIPDSYKRYILNSIRKDFDMPGVPIRVSYVKTDNPYDKK